MTTARRAPAAAGPARARPWVSIVTAVHDVEPYLPAFMASIDAQRFDPRRIEIVAVDDGSTDRSRAILEDWAGRRAGVRVLSKPNGGQASARNLGLRHATGEWVTFTDPDDMLEPDFLAVAERFAAAQPDVELLAGKPVLLLEDVGRVSDSHPRRKQYRAGTRRVDLDREPNTFPGSATVSLYRRARIEELGLRFDERVRPNFEDGHFAVHYLLGLPAPVVALLREARYVYRKRAAGNSTLARSLGDPGRYSAVFEHGYLEVLDAARVRYGRIPPWLQQVLVYELSWYLSDDEKITTAIRIDDDLVPRFHELFRSVVRQLDPDVVGGHRVRRLKPVWIDILSHAGDTEPWHAPRAVRAKVDPEMGLQRISYRYLGRPPVEEFRAGGGRVEPAFAKHAARIYYRAAMLHERVAWLPLADRLEVRLDGRLVPIEDLRQRSRRLGWSRRRKARAPMGWLPPIRVLRPVVRAAGRWSAAARRRLIGLLAGSPPARARYRDAWVLMDRIYEADDSGERLFEHLRRTRPDINAWFVLARSSPDWPRLAAAFPDRLVARGSLAWQLLMHNAAWLLSSHADLEVVEPREIAASSRARRWKFAFLQHGVMKDDLSVWLNQRNIDLFVVSTDPELESVAGDGTAYVYTHREARNTGLPRFDGLLRRAAEIPPEARDLVILAPTWRTWLTLPSTVAERRRQLVADVRDTEFFRQWQGLISAPAIAEAAGRAGLRLAFMPHPNLQPILDDLALPPHVVPLSFNGSDVQEIYARCALLVTDYSSVAFNVALLDRPVVYFQFDREAVLSGGHMGRPGYFDYERHGFGPVARDLESAVRAVVEAIDRGPVPEDEYLERINRTFSNRDGRACERVVAAVEELSRPCRARMEA